MNKKKSKPIKIPNYLNNQTVQNVKIVQQLNPAVLAAWQKFKRQKELGNNYKNSYGANTDWRL